MKKIYIHVGMQKTGSTWLQSNYFPMIKSHNVIYKDSFRHLFYKLNPQKNLIITYENYVGYPHPLPSRGWNGWMVTRNAAISNLSKFFPDADVILVLRKQSDLIKSLYNQYVKVGGNIVINDYWYGGRSNSIERDALKYIDLIDFLKQKFNGRILVLDFSLFVKDKTEFSRVFGGFIGGVNSFDVSDSYQSIVNKSLRWKDIRSLLMMYKLFGNNYNYDSVFKLPIRTFKILRWFSINFCSIFYSNASPITNEIEKSIQDYYADDWTEISSMMKNGYFVIDGEKVTHDI